MTKADNATLVDAAEVQYLGSTAYAWLGAANAPTVVFIHGVGMNKYVWDAQVADLAADHSVLVYDLLGHGDSALPPEPTHLADLSQQLLALLDGLGIGRADVVGHSMGSLVAIEFALAHPERVNRLVALNPVYRRSHAQRRAVMQRAEEIAADSTALASDETIHRWFTPEERARQPAATDRIRDWLDSVDAEGYARIYKAFATSDAAFVGRLGDLHVPALFMTGSDDPNSTPEMSIQLASEAPNSSATVLDDQRHMMAYIAPHIVNERIRTFIAKH